MALRAVDGCVFRTYTYSLLSSHLPSPPLSLSLSPFPLSSPPLQGPELASQDQRHGTIMWNTRSWVWYHPVYPHTIRFDLDKSGNFLFRPSPSATGKSAKTEPHTYANWTWDGAVLRSTGGGGGKKVPECGEWRMDGDVPVAAVMLVGMSEFIIQHSSEV